MRASMEAGKMECALFVVVASLVTMSVSSATAQCYIGTQENQTLMECTPHPHTRSKRQSVITQPVVGIHTKVGVPASVEATGPPNKTLAYDLQNKTQIESLQNETLIPNLQNTSKESVSSGLKPTLEEDPSSTTVSHWPQSCLIFVARNTSFAENGIFHDCDYSGLCDNVESQEAINASYKGFLGVAHCCHGVGCNSDRNHSSPVTAKTLKCFHGANQTTEECPSSGWVCVNSSQISNELINSTAVTYGCKPLNDSSCFKGSSSECIKLNTSSGQQINCCCATDHCNAPAPVAQVTSNANEDEIFDSFDNIKWFVYGSAIVVSASILASTAMIIYRWRRRRLEEDDECITSNPRFQRLAANFTAGDTDDVKMLLADPEC